MTEIPGLEYVLDLIGERELPPGFPAASSNLLSSGKRLIYFSDLQHYP